MTIRGLVKVAYYFSCSLSYSFTSHNVFLGLNIAYLLVKYKEQDFHAEDHWFKTDWIQRGTFYMFLSKNCLNVMWNILYQPS
jgi:hypothetical protein